MLVLGCAAPEREVVGEWQGPTTRAALTRAPWSFMGDSGEVLISTNYRLYSTVDSAVLREKTLQLLEAAYGEYRKLIPTAPSTDKPMEAYLFGTLGEWTEFTRRATGAAAPLYLKLEGKGYAHEDYFVASFRGGQQWDLWSVTGHEALHQFFSRHAKCRLPPVIEEGLACTFEVIHWGDSSEDTRELPRFNTKVNPGRARSLKAAVDSRAMILLADLVKLHAGSVLGADGMRIQAFYAEGWALARFLQEYDNGKYRQRFAAWIADTVSGDLYDPTGTHARTAARWNPEGVKPVIEHYLGTDLGTLSKEFDGWCDYLVKDELPLQWNSR